jgi:phage-related protein
MQRVAEMSTNAYKNLTLSQNAYLKAFEGSYSIINNGIGKNADAIKYTNSMIQMSTDLYNTYGGTVEQYQGAINWALKGTYSYLDNLNVGIKGTKEGFIEAANKSGILKKNISDTSELTNDQILDVIQHYVKAAGALGRTEKEAGETIQGSMNMVKATWNNLIAGFSKDGANIDKLIKQFINSAATFIGNLLPVIERATMGIINALPNLLNKMATMLPSVLGRFFTQSLPVILRMLITMLMNLIKSLVKVIPKIIPPVITAILDALLMLLDNIDMLIDCGIQLVFGIIDGITACLPKLMEKAPIIIIKLVGALIRAFPKLAAAAIQIPLKIWSGIIKGIPTLIKRTPKIVKDMVSTLKKEITKFKEVGVNMAKGLWNGVKDMKDWVINKVKGMGKDIVKGLKKALGIKSPSKEFAIIGRFSMLGYQEGLEKMKPQIDKAINGMFSLSPSLTGTMNNTLSPNVNVVNNINVETDPLGQVVSKIKTFSGGAKNDYNYGYGG